MDVSAYRRIAPELIVDFIRPSLLSSYRAYNRLKILPFLYRRYADFEYVLTYELDAFVFRDLVGLNTPVVCLLGVFDIELDPSRVSRSHHVRVIAVNVQRRGQSAVSNSHHDWCP